MKKLIIILMFLSAGIVFGQANWTKYNKIEGRNTQQVKGDSSAVMIFLMNPTLPIGTGSATSANQTNGTQRTGIISYTSGGYGAFTAGTAVDTLSGTSVTCVEVEIMNNSAGKILYYGFDGSTSTSNGMGALGYLDTARIRISNLNKLYLISDSATTNVRYAYFNF